MPSDPAPEQLVAVAEVIYRVEAPRYGNDTKPYAELGHWERKKYETMAKVAISKWEAIRDAEG